MAAVSPKGRGGRAVEGILVGGSGSEGKEWDCRHCGSNGGGTEEAVPGCPVWQVQGEKMPLSHFCIEGAGVGGEIGGGCGAEGAEAVEEAEHEEDEGVAVG